MNKNLIIGGLAAIVIVLLGLSFLGRPETPSVFESNQESEKATSTEVATTAKEPPKTTPATPKVTVTPSKPSASTGRVIFAVTDAAVNIADIKSIFVTISEVKMHSPTKGWLGVPLVPKKLDLLELRRSASLAFLTESNITKETYDQVWLTVKDVIVVKFDGITSNAKLPSGIIKFPLQMKVNAGDTMAITFDFDVDKSLHASTNGSYVFFPFLKISSQASTIVQIRSSGQILVSSGVDYTSREIGMDENGDVEEGFSLRSATQIELLGDIFKIGRTELSESGLVIPATRAIEIVTSGGSLDKILSIELVSKNGPLFWEITGLKKSVRTTIYMDPANGSIVQF
ncbi:MAG: DUF4382 domain-containing protein [Patescibacteria group bacterium]